MKVPVISTVIRAHYWPESGERREWIVDTRSRASLIDSALCRNIFAPFKVAKGIENGDKILDN